MPGIGVIASIVLIPGWIALWMLFMSHVLADNSEPVSLVVMAVVSWVVWTASAMIIARVVASRRGDAPSHSTITSIRYRCPQMPKRWCAVALLLIVRVPPLPADAAGEITLHVIYTRSRDWASSWEISAGDRIPADARRIPEDGDPRFRQFRALIAAAEAGNVAEVDRLIGQRAPLSWNTTGDSPLVSAAGRQRGAVVERLLRDLASSFALPDIEEAVWRAADPNEDDISGLRLLVGRFGTRLTPAARVRILRKAAESNQLNEGRLVPAGPAIRYLTLIDFVGGGNEHCATIDCCRTSRRAVPCRAGGDDFG